MPGMFVSFYFCRFYLFLSKTTGNIGQHYYIHSHEPHKTTSVVTNSYLFARDTIRAHFIRPFQFDLASCAYTEQCEFDRGCPFPL